MLGTKKCRFLLESKNLIGQGLESPRNKFYILGDVIFDSRGMKTAALSCTAAVFVSPKKMKTSKDLYKLWQIVSGIPEWLRLLWLTGEYSKEELSIIEEIDDAFFRIADKEEKKWKEWNYGNLPKTESGWLKIFPEARPYLKERLKNCRREKRNLSLEIKENLANVYEKVRDEFSIWFWEKCLEVFKGESLERLSRKIREIKFALDSPEAKKGKITNEMIEKAKQYPIENLIENKRGFAICPFHPDKKPSLFLRNNYAHCFACGYTADSVKLYRDLTGADFKIAVQHLSNF